MRRNASVSPCGRYRYSLDRHWGTGARDERFAWFIMLNPSTADAKVDDPTIRRCIGFAKDWGCHGLHVVNLYAFRATDPRALWEADIPVGEGQINDGFIRLAASNARQFGDVLVAAWGVNARPDRVKQVQAIVSAAGAELQCLGTTKAGAPRHPLYLPRTAQLSKWELPA